MRIPLVFAIVLAAACGKDIDPPRPAARTIAPATFAAVVAELALARTELLPDTAAYRARIDQILARYDVTARELRTFAAGYGGNEDVVMAAYRLEQARLDSLFEAGGAPPPAIGAPADTIAPVAPEATAAVPVTPDTTAPVVPEPGAAAPAVPESGAAAPADSAPGR